MHAMVCENCFLVQLDEFESPEAIFSDYAYFSSFSDSWLAHCRTYVQNIVPRLALGAKSLVVELASNDGYLLQYFKERCIPVLGVEPAANVAAHALHDRGIPTEIGFFTRSLAQQLAAQGKQADLLIGNNVLAHVPDINDFVAGMKCLLAPGGTITMEFPHLLQLIQHNQFDTIYHEHFSYLSLYTVQQILNSHGLCVFDVDTLPTHGGSIRIYAGHEEDARPQTGRPARLVEEEKAQGMLSLPLYSVFNQTVQETKRHILTYLIKKKEAGLRIAAYGAPAKGNTLLNYCGIGTDFIEFTVDRNPHKQNTLLPGSHIPVLAPEALLEYRPDITVILPWNLREEIIPQLLDMGLRDTMFTTFIPNVREWPGISC